MKLSTIADKGDTLETLKKLRHILAETIDNSNSGRDISSLARQLQIVMTQIEELEQEKKYREEDTILDIVRRKKAVRDNKGRPLTNNDD